MPIDINLLRVDAGKSTATPTMCQHLSGTLNYYLTWK